MQQYKDELLSACIELVLSAPRQFVQVQLRGLHTEPYVLNLFYLYQVSQLVPALQTSFRIGLRYLPLARVGLDALEHWLRVIPRQTIEGHLREILPPLNDYLSKEWLEQREGAILEGLSYETGSSRKKNRSEVIEKMKLRDEEKVLWSALSTRFLLPKLILPPLGTGSNGDSVPNHSAAGPSGW